MVTAETSRLFGGIWSEVTDEGFESLRGAFPKLMESVGFDTDWFKGKLCIDIGCGTGRLAASLVDYGAERVYACDITDEGFAVGKEHAPEVEFRVANALQLPYPRNMFDFAVASGVLGHTDNAVAGVQELYRILKPDGLAYTLFYSKSFRWEVFEQIRPYIQRIGLERFSKALADIGVSSNKYWIDCLFIPLITTYSDDDINRMFREAGFVIEQRWNSLEMDSIPLWGDAEADFRVMIAALCTLERDEDVEHALRFLNEALAVLRVLAQALPRDVLDRFLFGSANHRTLARAVK